MRFCREPTHEPTRFFALAGERIAKAKTWPDSARALASRLRRAATFLRKIGIEIGFEREGRTWTRIIRITTKPSSTPETGGTQPSASSANQPKFDGKVVRRAG